MKKVLLCLLGSLLLSLSLTSCLTMDFTDFKGLELDAEGESIVRSVQSIKRAASDITPEEEYSLGRITAVCIIDRYGGLYKNSEKTKYVNKICGALVVNSEKPYLHKGYSVGILNTYDLNAISTPGGHIFITKGMYEIADSEDALAALIAHEIAHIQLNHASNAIKVSRKLEAVTTTIDAVDKVTRSEEEAEEENWVQALSLGYVEKVINDGFSSEQEYEADAYALQLLIDAGYDPKAMVDCLNTLKQKQNGNSTLDITHPKPADRLDRVNKILVTEPYKSCTANKADRMARFKKYK